MIAKIIESRSGIAAIVDPFVLFATAWGGYALGWEWSNIILAALAVAVVLFGIASRYLLGLVLTLLVAAGTVSAFGEKHLAEDVSVWAFFAIVIMLLAILLESGRDPSKKEETAI